MIHAKTLMIDGVWSVVGSTNFDNRSFGLNDEVNLAARCAPLAARLGEDFDRDLQRSRRITLEELATRLAPKRSDCSTAEAKLRASSRSQRLANCRSASPAEWPIWM